MRLHSFSNRKSLCTLRKIRSSEYEAARVAAGAPWSCLRAFYSLSTLLSRGGVIHHSRLEFQPILFCMLSFGILEHVILCVFTSMIILILIHCTVIDKRVSQPGHIAADLVRVPSRLEAPLGGLLFSGIQLSVYVLDYIPVPYHRLLLFFPLLELLATTNLVYMLTYPMFICSISVSRLLFSFSCSCFISAIFWVMSWSSFSCLVILERTSAMRCLICSSLKSCSLRCVAMSFFNLSISNLACSSSVFWLSINLWSLSAWSFLTSILLKISSNFYERKS